MGTTSTKDVKIPNQLMETPFTETVFESVIPNHMRSCQPDNICTDRITGIFLTTPHLPEKKMYVYLKTYAQKEI